MCNSSEGRYNCCFDNSYDSPLVKVAGSRTPNLHVNQIEKALHNEQLKISTLGLVSANVAQMRRFT